MRTLSCTLLFVTLGQCIFTSRLNLYWPFNQKLMLLLLSSRMKNCCSVCPHFACRTEHTTILYFVFFAFICCHLRMNYRNKITILSMQRDKVEDNHMSYIWKKSQTGEKSMRGICVLSKQFGPLSARALWRKNCGTFIESNSYSL